MIGLVLCSEHIRGLEMITQDTPAPLLRLCGRTMLERTLDRLIAAGMSEACIVSERPQRRIENILKRYDNRDKIALSTAEKADELTLSADSSYLVCAATACADTDIAGLLKGTGAAGSVCFTDRKGSFIMAKLTGEHIKLDSLTSENSLYSALLQSCLSAEKRTVDADVITGVNGFLSHQGQTLDRQCGVKSLTDSNFNGTTIIEPAYIGRNVTIKSGAVIGRGSVIDDDALIGQGAEVTGSYVGRCAVVGKNSRLNGAYVGESSVLMNRAVLSGGAALCNEVCFKANCAAVGSEFVSPHSSDYREMSFTRGAKHLVFDDDGICSLFDGTADVSSYVRLGKAAASALGFAKTIAVGNSSEKNMSVLAQALICGIRSAGTDVYDIGDCTVPQLGHAVNSTSSELGIFVGVDANGDIRLVQQGGLPLEAKLEEEICLRYDLGRFRNVCVSDLGKAIPAQSEKAAYERFLSDLLPKSFKGLNACVRTSDPACAEMCDRLFYPANDVCGERIIFRLSGDLMSMNAYSDATGNVRWEQLCLLGCKIMFEENRPVSLPYSMPASAEKLASRFQGTISRYYTVSAGDGDAKAREIACLEKGSFVRDALVLCVMICSYLEKKRISLKTALEDIGSVCFTQRYINGCADEPVLLENAQAVGDEGVTVSDEHTTAFVRPSKDRRNLIIFAESTKTEFASAFCDELSEKLQKRSLFGY